MNVLTFDHVSCRYPGQGTDIVDRLSFEVKPGSFHCILGVSGCGKSTLFRMISGLMSPEKGSIYVNGKPVCGHGSYCGYMPQKDMLFPWRSVGENLALPLEIQRKLGKKEQRQQVEAALAEVGLAGCADKRPDELSGGMRQRAAFARTMLTGSDLLLLDTMWRKPCFFPPACWWLNIRPSGLCGRFLCPWIFPAAGKILRVLRSLICARS